jgi:hypothetical protein
VTGCLLPRAEAAGKPDDPRGLNFICLNADIADQLETVRQSWLNRTHFLAACIMIRTHEPLSGRRHGSESLMGFLRAPPTGQALTLPLAQSAIS